MMHDLSEMDPDQFFERCWQPMVLYVVFIAFWTPAVQLLTSIFPAGPWRRVAVDAESTLGRRVGWATLQMVSLMGALLALILLHAMGCRALLAVQAGARTVPAIAAPYDLQLQQLQWSQQSQQGAQIQAMWEAFSRTAEHHPTPPTGATDAGPGAHSPPDATPHAEPGTHSPPAATPHAEPAADTRPAPSTGRTTTRRAAEAATPATALPPGGCLVPATFNSYTALHAQHCVSTHLLSTQSAYSNTLAAARSLGSLFDERHGAGASISRVELLRVGDGLLPTFFGEWWDPSLGTLLVEAPRL